MGERPEGTTLERRDNDGAYTSKNCRWATRAEQQQNTRVTKLDMRSVKGIKKLSSLGFPQSTIGWLFDVDQSLISRIVNNSRWR